MTDLKTTLATRADGDAAAGPRALTLPQRIERQKEQIALALPKHMTVDRFARVLVTEVKRTPKLAICTPESVLGAVMLAAQLGLEPGPTQLSFLIPRWNKNVGANEAQFQIGYRGMIDLARRSGQVLSIDAHVVYERDEFEFRYGLDPLLSHVPKSSERGDPLWAYSVARFKDGGSSFVVLSIDEIERRRERSQAAKNGPWVTDWAAMARKTAVRALAPFLPQSPEIAHAERFDGVVVTDYTGNILDSDETYATGDVLDVEGEEETVGAGASAASEASPGEDATGGGTDASTAADEDAPAPDEVDVSIGTARREVESYRATKAAGATTKHNALDAWLNDRELGMDLEGLTPELAVELIEYLAKNPIGKRRGDA